MCFANVDRLLVDVMAAGLVLGHWLSSAAQRLDLPVLELLAGKHQHREFGDSAGGEPFEHAVGHGWAGCDGEGPRSRSWKLPASGPAGP